MRKCLLIIVDQYFWPCKGSRRYIRDKNYLSLCRARGQPGVPAGPCRPQLGSVDLGHSPLSPGGSSSPLGKLELQDYGGCRTTSFHKVGIKTHHRDKPQSPPADTTLHSDNAPSFCCDLSRTWTNIEKVMYTGWMLCAFF